MRWQPLVKEIGFLLKVKPSSLTPRHVGFGRAAPARNTMVKIHHWQSCSKASRE